MNLKITNLTRLYRGKAALSGINLNFSGGDVCLLLGPNGSGKTTMMKMIAGLVSPSSGSIELNGAPLRTADKAHIAYMPTENYFYSYMSVKDAGRYYADFFPDFDMHAYLSMIDRAEMEPGMRIRTLSSGMSAKLRLALTLSRDAGIMMFDEPINGVDMLTRDWVLDEIARRRDGNRIMLISTHLVEQAEKLANCAVFLRRGQLALSGRMDEICRESALEDLYRSIYGGRGEVE